MHSRKPHSRSGDLKQEEAAEIKRYQGPWFRILNLLLALASTLAMATTTTLSFVKSLGHFAASIPFLPLIPLVADSVNMLYRFPRFLLKPSSLKIKVPVAIVMLASYLSGSAAMLINTLANFGVSQLVAVTPFTPIMIVSALSGATLLNAFGLALSTREYVSKPWARTPEANLRLAHRGVKTAAYATATAVIVPLLMATGMTLVTASLVNPFTAGPAAATLFAIMITALTTLTVMRLVKTYANRRLQESAAENAARLDAKDPYATLGLKLSDINKLSHHVRMQHIKSAYDNKERLLIGNTPKADLSVRTLGKLKKNYQAYELLKSPRTTLLYQTFTLILRANQENPLPSPEETLKINRPMLAIKPFSWIKYQVALFSAPDEEQEAIHRAYRILSTRALYRCYQATEQRRQASVSSEGSDEESYCSPTKIRRALSQHDNRVHYEEDIDHDYSDHGYGGPLFGFGKRPTNNTLPIKIAEKPQEKFSQKHSI